MLAIQNWLLQNDFNYSLLEEELAIKANFHPTDERVILNYCQIESPKYNEIVRSSRGIILNKTNASLIGRSFFRFFNWGEDLPSMKNFAWDNCYINSKEDGSLITIYYYDGKWRLNTRNSYGDGIVNDSGFTWLDIFNQALLPNGFTLDDFDQVADKEISLVFELCSPYNQIVRHYPQPTLFLLAIFNGEHEWTPLAVDEFAKQCGFNRPFQIHCLDPFEVTGYIAKLAEKDRTFEGFCLRDCHNTRFKFKSEEYLKIHRLGNNGHIASWKNIVPIALAGENDEIISYFPYIKEKLKIAESSIDTLTKELYNLWQKCWHLKSRKEFAASVKLHPFSCLLFSVYGKDRDEVNIRQELAKFETKIVDYLEERYK